MYKLLLQHYFTAGEILHKVVTGACLTVIKQATLWPTTTSTTAY